MAQGIEHGSLNLAKEKLSEVKEIDATRLWIEIMAGIEPPAQVPRSAVSLVVRQFRQGFPQGFKLL